MTELDKLKIKARAIKSRDKAMKVTNYEISKRLSEIGFRSDPFERCYKKGEPLNLWNRAFEVSCWGQDLSDYYPAYELETLLEALPTKVIRFGDDGIAIDNKSMALPIISIKKPNQSLADCAAGLLVKLHEKGLIKFGEKHDR